VRSLASALRPDSVSLRRVGGDAHWIGRFERAARRSAQ
jgi:hypothetical protein